MYTGACPQTLVFEALNRVRHLEFLHNFQQQKIRTSNTKLTSSHDAGTRIKHVPQKSKVSLPTTDRIRSLTNPNKNAQALSCSMTFKPLSGATHSEKSQSVLFVKKVIVCLKYSITILLN